MVTSWRSESRYIGLVILDHLLFGLPPLQPFEEVNPTIKAWSYKFLYNSQKIKKSSAYY